MPNLQRMILGSLFAICCASILAIQGCVSYDERAVVHSDGSGEIRIVVGVARDNTDHQRLADVKLAVSRLRGIRWISDIDSFAGPRHWVGAVIQFDSVEALRPLNSIVALESLFNNIRIEDTDSGMILRRAIKLPHGAAADGDFTRINWRFPGTIIASDRRAKLDSTGAGVRWDLPLGEEGKEWASTMVRWKKPLLSQPAWLDWMHCPPMDLFASCWLIGLQALTLLGLMVLAILVPTRIRAIVRDLARKRR